MSGIAGLIRFDGGPVEPGLVEAMVEAMAHRGPDATACHTRGSAGLGHCMLRSTPESLAETQPLANEDASVVLTMDGRVDNRDELQDALAGRGARLRDGSDAELVLRSYEAWGAACVERIDGDFALLVRDDRRGEAFLARDRMGIRPLHYHWDGRCLAVASELRAILALPWVDEELNEGLIAEHLASDLASLDETVWKGVLRLPPAHRMVVGAAGPEPRRYWSPDLDAELRYRREDEYVEHYRTLLADVVRRQSRARAPIACEVSGGLDSSAVFGVGEHLWRRGQLGAPRIDGYTLAFGSGAAGADLDFARAVGAHLGRTVEEIAPTFPPLDWYRDAIRTDRDLPCAPNGTMQLGIYEAAVARGSRVVFTGDGGDQWLTGNHTYFAGALAAGRPGEFLDCLRRDARAYGLGTALRLAARHGAVPLLPSPLRRRLRRLRAGLSGRIEDGPGWMSPFMLEILAERRRLRPPSPADRESPVHREKLQCLLNAQNVFAQELMDRLAARYGVELRSPLNSAAIAQFCFSVPQQWLLRNGRDRYLHRQALRGRLPDAVVDRRDKAEFSATIHRLASGLSEALAQPEARPESWLRHDGLAAIRAGAVDGRPPDLMRLWSIFACSALGCIGKKKCTGPSGKA